MSKRGCKPTQSCPTHCNPMDCSMPGFLVLHYLPKLAQVHVHWVSDGIQPSHPLLPPSFPALNLFPSIGVFSNKLALCIRWPKYWSFTLNISPSNKYSGVISFRIDWFDLFAIQGAFKSLLQHYSSKASVLRPSAFFMIQPSPSYMTTGKMITLIIWTFVGKVMLLLFNTLSSHLFSFKKKVSFNFKTEVIVCSDFGAQENKICHCFSDA